MLKSFLNDIFYIIHNYSFIQSFSIHHFSYSEQAGGYPSMHWRGGREGSQSVTQTDQHTHVHTRIHGQFRVFSSCCLHLFGQWKESGASSRNQGDAGRRCNHHNQVTVSFLKISFYILFWGNILIRFLAKSLRLIPFPCLDANMKLPLA